MFVPKLLWNYPFCDKYRPLSLTSFDESEILENIKREHTLHTYTSFFRFFRAFDCTWMTQMCWHFSFFFLSGKGVAVQPPKSAPSPPLRRHKAWPNWIVTLVLIKFYVRLLLGSCVCSCPAAPQQTMSLRVLWPAYLHAKLSKKK